MAFWKRHSATYQRHLRPPGSPPTRAPAYSTFPSSTHELASGGGISPEMVLGNMCPHNPGKLESIPPPGIPKTFAQGHPSWHQTPCLCPGWDAPRLCVCVNWDKDACALDLTHLRGSFLLDAAPHWLTQRAGREGGREDIYENGSTTTTKTHLQISRGAVTGKWASSGLD